MSPDFSRFPDYHDLVLLRQQHPAWRLLAAAHAPLVLTLLHAVFIAPNRRALPRQQLIAILDDLLFDLRQQEGGDAFPKPAAAYLDDWAGDDKGWLRKYYPEDSDEPHYDLTPAAVQALEWVTGLQRREFVGTESRLLLVFELLRQMAEGSETDPEARIAELERRRGEIDAEIARIRGGELELMDPTRLRDRFLQMQDTARRLLADFRAVEQNFRDLDRRVRERIATWEGGKGELLAEVFGHTDAIADSDEGRSFRAFWDFLMDPRRQEELTGLLEKILALEPVRQLRPDPRLRRIHYDWLEAGEATQRTVARLSQQLRRWLDDQTWLENRRIMALLRDIEQHAIAVRDRLPPGDFMTVDATAPAIELVMERPLFQPSARIRIEDRVVVEGEAKTLDEALFKQRFVDREALADHIRHLLRSQPQVSLARVVAARPLAEGLAELLTYLELAEADPRAVVDDARSETIEWTGSDGVVRRARVPLILYCR
ncbi:hypothetical protein MIN45_P0631 [Methylomarinovum tepidoasis]|uniref:DUF3375 domain-containing protein n=1 Tax=Methylomarinovum tepidoasis TaxID=2840183 RepID=A0AAU9C8S9_9GAMM|nr:DUF3375 domain-containing protein [Methylomarinovum sp. IN45]BCX88262.1 hypothetical protein MIN45_P0631 [Methylomarinovum sp. IN45]